MTTIDYAARLALVQAAIDALLTNKMREYDIDGQQVNYLDLKDLQAEETRLIAKINRQARRGGAFGRVVVR